MRQDEMIAIVEGHLKAEGAGDVEGAVAISTDIVHDAVGFPGSPLRARRGRGSSTGSSRPTSAPRQKSRFTGSSTATPWSSSRPMTGTVIGEMLGIPGRGRCVTFGILHAFAFRDGLVSREQVWIDAGSLVGQLTAA